MKTTRKLLMLRISINFVEHEATMQQDSIPIIGLEVKQNPSLFEI